MAVKKVTKSVASLVEWRAGLWETQWAAKKVGKKVEK